MNRTQLLEVAKFSHTLLIPNIDESIKYYGQSEIFPYIVSSAHTITKPEQKYAKFNSAYRLNTYLQLNSADKFYIARRLKRKN